MNEEEKRLKNNRLKSKRYYEKHKKEIKEKARKKRHEKNEREGRVPKPRGRPRKCDTKEEAEIVDRYNCRNGYHIKLMREGKTLNIEEMDECQLRNLVVILMKELSKNGNVNIPEVENE